MITGEYYFDDGAEVSKEYSSMREAINDIPDTLDSHDAYMESFKIQR